MKVFVKTFGCTFNKRDSENICGILVEGGFDLVDSESSADLIIVNSCGVKSITENRVMNFINALPKEKKVFVGGCLTRMVDVKKMCPRVEAVFDPNTIKSLLEVIGGKDVSSDVKENRLGAPIKRIEKEVAIIPICQGCVGDCTYCSVRFARGKLKSYAKEDILKEVKEAISSGCRRINLTAQDTGCYGLDINETLPSLLKEIITLPGDFIVRVGMANPNFILKYLDELIEIFKSPKVLKFLHIPLQSASNKVLKEMHRKYTVEQFKQIVKRFREEIPNIYLSTDIITGYPTETEGDFQETYNLLKELNLDVVNVSKFGPRPGTPASKLEQLKIKEIKKRAIVLHEFAINH